MTRYVRGLLFGLAMTFAAALATTATAADDDDKEIKEAQKQILDVTKMIEEGKDAKAIDAKVLAIKKKFDDLGTVMHIYKPKDKGGLGFGESAKGGVEFKIRDLAKRKLAPLTLQKEEKELIRMANLNIAMGKIARHYFSKPKAGKGKKEWDEHIANQNKAARDLIAAIKAKNTAKIKEVSDNLDNACNNCHSDFRD
jgi:hypothetical protein